MATPRAGFHREFDPTFPSPDLTVCSLCGLDPCDWDSDNPFDFHATRSPECPFVRATQQKKKHRNQKTRQQYKRSLKATQSATQPEHSVEQEEESLQQANAENTAEKPSDNTATIIKNTAQLSKTPRHMLSTIPRQTTTQQENITAIWPIISAALLWHTITELSIQEKDLLRRSQPNHYGYGNWTSAGKGHIGRCIFGRIETVRCLASTSILLFERLSLRQENLWDSHH
ncbi:hypothetical protein HO133_000516 [Letharia lupina]|uniref:Uncharacterized protein n=2 Tax=Letharia TaxID=112415 RepID=A0A8H6CHS7_9LECA|nr:uncharacterized protein HO133_000516 [Letharia lupina]KAF6223673.1 hypothetical protein HO133_000516 [Letharia lupina]